MSDIERPDDRDILRRLSERGVVPARGGSWLVSSRIVAWNAKEFPRALRCHVYAWPISSLHDVAPLIDALEGLPDVLKVRGLTEAERQELRWGVVVFRPTWQYEDFRGRGALGQSW